ncbi:MAG TPA: OmpA family protein [Edaphocola sp.]|nr:OmpA family protein [Edaphocola sp.]
MYPIIKYIAIPLLISGSINYSSYSQSNNSEIVMTKTELEALLTKIAKAKKEQLLKKQNILNRNNAIDDSLISLIQSSEKQSNNDQQILDEINRLHLRIDQLVLLQGKTNQGQPITPVSIRPINKTQTQEQAKSTDKTEITKTPTIPTNTKEQPSTIINNYYQTKEKSNQPPQTTIIKQTTNPDELKAFEQRQAKELSNLQSQIENLNEQIRVLTALNQSQKSNDNVQEILLLQSKIEALKSTIDNNSKRVDTVIKIVEVQKETPVVTTIKEQVKEETQAQQLKLTLYFANNSSTIDKKDYPELANIAKSVKDSKKTVVLRAFASNTGSAIYNQKLSFNRANTVKKVLMQNGLKANQIIILNHGIDNSTDAVNARRVEISLLLY